MTAFAMAPLLSAVLGSIGAGIGVTLAFSLSIFGAARFDDMRRVGRPVAASAFAVLGGAGGLAAIGLVVLGLILVTSK
jgi:hypothetical protein